MTKDKINASLFDEVKKLQREVAGLNEALAIANRSADQQMRYKREAEMSGVRSRLALEAAKAKLAEVISIARKGRYPAGDFVAVGKRLDAMDGYLLNNEVSGGGAVR